MKKILFTALLAATLSACSDYIEEIPQTSDFNDSSGVVGPVTYEVNGEEMVFERQENGDLLFQGDMIFKEENLQPDTRGAGYQINTKQWPNNTVYYVIDDYKVQRSTVEGAIRELEKKTNIIFLPRTNQSNYIHFVEGLLNSSYVGMTGGRQEITLSLNNDGISYNYTYITVMHEICHALGLHHEQSRKDRDNYIIINWSNIHERLKYNFDKYTTGTDFGVFDFNSIMLYTSIIKDPDIIKNPNIPTITKLDGSTYPDALKLSEGDIATLEAKYPFRTGKLHSVLTKETATRGAGMTVADVDGNGKNDLIMIYRVPAGENGVQKFYYKVLFDIDENGYPFRESTYYGCLEFKGDINNHGSDCSIAATDLDDNGQIDLIVVWDGKRATNQNLHYGVIMNLNQHGLYSSYKINGELPQMGGTYMGVGCDIWDIDLNGKPELIFATNNAQTDATSKLRYRIMYNLNENGVGDYISDKVEFPGMGGTAQGLGIACYSDSNNSDDGYVPSYGFNILFGVVDNPYGPNNFRYKIVKGCIGETSYTNITPQIQVSKNYDIGSGNFGGDCVITHIDGDGKLDIVMMANCDNPSNVFEGKDELRFVTGYNLQSNHTFLKWR